MRDPQSLALWLALWPSRHWSQIVAMIAVHPQWRESAERAREIVRAGSVPAPP